MSEVETKKRRIWVWLILPAVIAVGVFGYLYLNRTGPCGPEIYFVGTDYSNPHENMDSTSETTQMVFTFTGNQLSKNDKYIYYWHTRPFARADSFNKAKGYCDVYTESMLIQCSGLPLAGLDNLPTDGYEYTISLVYDNPECEGPPIHLQQGLIYLDTLEHKIVKISGRFMP